MEKLRPEQLREKANMLPLLPGSVHHARRARRGHLHRQGKSAQNRVTSYFRGEHLPKVAAMVAHVADFNVIVVQSEFEALVLENSLIKLHKPKYNILLKDDKGYHYIKVEKKPWGRISEVKRHPDDRAMSILAPISAALWSNRWWMRPTKLLSFLPAAAGFPRRLERDVPVSTVILIYVLPPALDGSSWKNITKSLHRR